MPSVTDNILPKSDDISGFDGPQLLIHGASCIGVNSDVFIVVDIPSVKCEIGRDIWRSRPVQ